MLDHDFKLQCSRLYKTVTGVFLFFSLLILMGLPITVWIKFFWLIFLVVYGVRIFRFSKPGTLRYSRETGWHIHLPKRMESVILSGESIVTRWFAVLRFRLAKQYYTYLVFRDSLSPGEYRRLFVLLNFSRSSSPGKGT